jgi:hypothetical protein
MLKFLFRLHLPTRLQTSIVLYAHSLLNLTLLTMKLSNSLVLALVAIFSSSTSAFTAPSFGRACARSQFTLASATMAESGVPPTTSDSSDMEDLIIPTKLPSDVGMDYIPLATMLATGQLAEADQVRGHSFHLETFILVNRSQ